jgi:hypothetical protein
MLDGLSLLPCLPLATVVITLRVMKAHHAERDDYGGRDRLAFALTGRHANAKPRSAHKIT